MKNAVLLFCLLLASCSANVDTEANREPVASEAEPRQTAPERAPVGSEASDIIADSLLEVLQLKGLVSQAGDAFQFTLPFDLHGLDCGAPDCYSTQLSFNIPGNDPVVLPDTIKVLLREFGCVDEGMRETSAFVRREQAGVYLNYYSADLKSNLIIGPVGEIYYYPHLEARSKSLDDIENAFAQAELNDDVIIPYRSTVMISTQDENLND